MDAVSWLPDPSESSLRAALRRVAPGLAERPAVIRAEVATDNPDYLQGHALVDGAVLVKFAWSRPPAERLVHEAAVLAALADAPPRASVPELVFASRHPALLGTRLVPGDPLAPADANLDGPRRHRLADELGCFLAELHRPETLAQLRRAGVRLTTPSPQADTDTLRARFTRLVDAPRRRLVARWCDWADRVLAEPPRHRALLHADLHGFNLVIDRREGALRAVADWETAAVGDPAYDLRGLPSLDPEARFCAEVARAYRRRGHPALDPARVMAWHLRTAFGDALWRTEAGVSLPGGGTPSSWVDDFATRLRARLTAPAAC